MPTAGLGQATIKPRVVNLDGDPALEQVIPQTVCSPLAGASVSACPPDKLEQQRMSCKTTFRDVTRRYAGKELRLRETYVDRNDALCCPSFERITWFGYNAGKDLYVRFRTHVKRIGK